MTIEVDGLYKSFGRHPDRPKHDRSELNVLSDISFGVDTGSFISFMGPSGCGKTTLLNILAGLIDADRGTIKYNGAVVDPRDIPYAYVFQEPRLLNWLTGEEDTYPLKLSGGMQQRVGLARALAVEKDVLLMDEPFSALDELTAQNLREDVVDLWEQTEKTIIFITHNIAEAIFLSDEIHFMNHEGRIFNHREIDFDRPREFQDEKLKLLEASIMDDFFSSIGDR